MAHREIDGRQMGDLARRRLRPGFESEHLPRKDGEREVAMDERGVEEHGGGAREGVLALRVALRGRRLLLLPTSGGSQLSSAPLNGGRRRGRYLLCARLSS